MSTTYPYSQSRTRDMSKPPEWWRTSKLDTHQVQVLAKHRVIEKHETNPQLSEKDRLATDPVVSLQSHTRYKVLRSGQILNYDKGSARAKRRHEKKYGRAK